MGGIKGIKGEREWTNYALKTHSKYTHYELVGEVVGKKKGRGFLGVGPWERERSPGIRGKEI